MIPGRLTWRDSRGMTRFASVVTRDVSDSGVYLECRGGDAIPLFRLVYLQLDRGTREVSGLPGALRDGRVLSAVYRVGPCEPTTGTPSGYALRLLVEPSRRHAEHAGAALIEPVPFDRARRHDTGELTVGFPPTPASDLPVPDLSDLASAEPLVL